MSTAVPQSETGSKLRKLESFFAGSALRRGITLTLILAILQVTLFWQYYLGYAIPPYDFLGSYAGDAYAWWTDGGFFEREEWVPYVWGGYPSASVLQNSGWYLPVGIAAAITDYTLHVAAIVSALHVALGAYGMYALLRALRTPFGISVFGSVAMTFGVGFFSNASHVDIARAYAWLPWVLLMALPVWKWNKWWGIPVATFVFWQALTGIYPGIAFAAVYVLVPVIVAASLIYRPKFRSYLLPLMTAAVAAVLLSMPRLLPYVLIGGSAPINTTVDLAFEPSLFGTLLFGYGPQHELVNDLTMRSFFVPATVLALAVFARWSDPLCKLALVICVPAGLLGLPFWPWFTPAQNLPGLDLSRFTMSDFKLFLVGGAILLAVSGLRMLTSKDHYNRTSRSNGIRLLLVWVMPLFFGVIAVRGTFSPMEIVPPLLLLCVILAVLTAYVMFSMGVLTQTTQLKKRATQWFVGSLTVLTAASGLFWAYSTPAPWLVDREPTEIAVYGDTVDNLISIRKNASPDSIQRPARDPLPEGFQEADLWNNAGNAAYYSGEYSIAAYINMKNFYTNIALVDALTAPERAGIDFAAFLAMPGTVMALPDSEAAAAEQLMNCVSTNSCGVNTTPKSYASGDLTYAMQVDSETTVILNEAFFTGWNAQVCSSEGNCETIPASMSTYGTIQLDLPAGEFDLRLTYEAPGRQAGWVLFGGGIAIMLGAIVISVFTTQRTKAKNHE